MTRSPISRVNGALKQAGRSERLVKGRGYMYFRGGELDVFLGSIYMMNLEQNERDYQALRSAVVEAFAARGVTLAI